MAFSGALQLTDLDDFLAPSQACILPVKQKNKVTDQADGVNPEVSKRNIRQIVSVRSYGLRKPT
jgi:threonyl-tRNA synthetase